MKTACKTGKIVALMLVAVMLVFMLCACSSASIEDKLVGTWVAAEHNKKYPDTLTLYNDGKGTVKDATGSVSITWHYSNDTKELELMWQSIILQQVSVSFSSDTLYLDGFEYNRA